MARARNIKPGFFTNGDLVELPLHTRLLFIGLWCLADREGRLQDRPKQIKMEVFPADNLDVDASLDELAAAGFITRYRVGDRSYIQVVNFLKHQRPHHKEKESTIPAQDMIEAESRSATTPSPNEKAKHGPASAQKPGKRKSHEPAEGFDEFWAEYPKRVAKEDAIAAWNKLAPDAELRESILADLRGRQPAWKTTTKKYIPNPATYLNGRRWTDELPGPDADADGASDSEEDFMRVSGQRVIDETRGTEGPR